jgi:SAM-dependent methyltransferase
MEEVHLWRGSAEQRALRSHCWKTGQFAYFDRQLDFPIWTGKKVLDFGGNAGSLLMDEGCEIRHEDYYCLDVLDEALDMGRKRYPGAHWIHYDRYNCSFNPEGVPDLPIPEMGVDFDMILAYSVFTHTTRDDMDDLVRQLKSRLASGGVLAFTFIDPHWKSWPETYQGNNLSWRLERAREANSEVDVIGLMEQSYKAAWCALVGNTELYVDSSGAWERETEECLSYHVYYTEEFLQRAFPHATFRAPVNGEMQHCCIMRKELS